MKTIITINPWKKSVYDDIKFLLKSEHYLYRINCKTSVTDKDFDNLSEILKKIINLHPNIKLILDIGFPKDSIRSTVHNDNYYLEIKDNKKVIISFDKKSVNSDYLYFEMEQDFEIVKLSIGDKIIYADGENELTVSKVISKNTYECTVCFDGILWGNTSFHFKPEIMIYESNINHIQKLVNEIGELRIEAIALSFVENQTEVKIFKEKFISKVNIISKIESRKGLENIEEIAEISQGLMLGRGDLGYDLAFDKFGLLDSEKRLISVSRNNSISSIIATDIFNSLTQKIFPSRGDIIDFEVLCELNPDYFVLSGQLVRSKYSLIPCLNIIKQIKKNYDM